MWSVRRRPSDCSTVRTMFLRVLPPALRSAGLLPGRRRVYLVAMTQ